MRATAGSVSSFLFLLTRCYCDLKPCSLFIRSLSRLATPTSDAPLIRLDLSGELVTCEGAKTLAAVLQVSLSLRSLLLRRTPIGDLGALALGAALSSSALVELDLGECALTDQGLRALVRGPQVHGAPPCLSVLLLDGNATGDVGTTEVISYLERQSTLRSFSIHPSLPRGLSQEVEAALQVACELSGVTLDHKGRLVSLRSRPGEALSLDRLASCCGKRHEVAPSPSPVAVPVATPALPAPVPPEPLQRAPGVGWSPSSAVAERTPRKPVPDMRQSGHLASWMAGTERELRELKWLLSSSSARLDGQHRKLMSELEKLRLQLDAWTSDAAPPPDWSGRGGGDAAGCLGGTFRCLGSAGGTRAVGVCSDVAAGRGCCRQCPRAQQLSRPSLKEISGQFGRILLR
ncbi:unnamed protein product [Durusdinium trenchii]|uniref:Uncharacterized protein n=1 Tax=Durusdinium trenchii TaxID=1381693 RepID=A0ABP0NTB9_9DINO